MYGIFTYIGFKFMVHVNIPVPWSICETSLGEARSTGGTETLETVGDRSHSHPNNEKKNIAFPGMSS